jgi:murein L,D-transpeptidase YafK
MHNRGKMLTSEARIAYESQRYPEAESKAKKAVELVTASNLQAGQKLKEYFQHYPKWSSLADQAIKASKGGNRVILVDKLAHKLMVYKSGVMTHSFDAEFGKNWMGDKLRRGDKATPEGIYKITARKDRATNTIKPFD